MLDLDNSFLFIPKVFEVRTLCRPVKFLHTKLFIHAFMDLLRHVGTGRYQGKGSRLPIKYAVNSMCVCIYIYIYEEFRCKSL